MENRFGFKDLLVVTILLALLVSVWLAMKQYDRQWQRMDRMTELLGQLTTSQARMEREMGALHDAIENGVVAAAARAPATPNTETLGDPFDRLRQTRQDPGFASGDWLVDAFSASVSRITPLVTGDAYGSAIQDRVLQTLVDRDPVTLEWRPLLARSWQVSDDGLTFTFQLRRGVTFSDGQPLTTDDILFTWDLINNPAIDAPRARNYYDKIESVTATGPLEVVFNFKEPYFQAMGMAGGMEVLPKHFFSRFTPEQINRQPGLLLGSGPYRMPSPTDWKPGDPLMLVRNERYWGIPPAFDRMVFKEINNPVAQLTAYRNGEIDLFGAMPEQYITLKDDPQIKASSQQFEYERPTSGYGFICWNQRKAGKPTIFADVRVRRAMTMLVNRPQMNKEILLGYGIIPSGPFNRLSKQYNHDVPPLPYDPEQAKALLREAGFQDRNGDQVLDGPDGKPLEFRYTFPAADGVGFWDRVGLLIKDNMARAGVSVVLDPLEWAVFKEKLDSRNFDAISLAWGGGLESDIRQMFHSSQIGEGADNFGSYANPKFDELCDLARRTVDEDQRMKLWRECHRILNEDQPYTFLYSRKALVFIDKRIHNVQRIAIGLNDQTEWWVPKGMQKYKE